MESPTPEVQIKRVVLSRMQRCSVCHRSYEHEDIHIVSRRSDMWMMVVECDECHGRNFVAAVLNDGDPNQARMALQEMSDDVGSGPPSAELLLGNGASSGIAASSVGASEPPVSAGDVADMHSFLGSFDGDFTRLFKEASE